VIVGKGGEKKTSRVKRRRMPWGKRKPVTSTWSRIGRFTGAGRRRRAWTETVVRLQGRREVFQVERTSSAVTKPQGGKPERGGERQARKKKEPLLSYPWGCGREKEPASRQGKGVQSRYAREKIAVPKNPRGDVLDAPSGASNPNKGRSGGRKGTAEARGKDWFSAAPKEKFHPTMQKKVFYPPEWGAQLIPVGKNQKKGYDPRLFHKKKSQAPEKKNNSTTTQRKGEERVKRIKEDERRAGNKGRSPKPFVGGEKT